MKSVIVGLLAFSMSVSAQAVVTLKLDEGRSNEKNERITVKSIEVARGGVYVETKNGTYLFYHSSLSSAGISPLEFAKLIKENAGSKGNIVISGATEVDGAGLMYVKGITVSL